MQTAILISGQASGNFTLKNAITSGNIPFSIEDSRFNGFVIYFNSKSEAKKACDEAVATALRAYNEAWSTAWKAHDEAKATA